MQNDLDMFVNRGEPDAARQDRRRECGTGGGGGGAGGPAFGYGAMLGIPEVFVPAGFADSIYDAQFVLSADGKSYEGEESKTPTSSAASACRTTSASGPSPARRRTC